MVEVVNTPVANDTARGASNQIWLSFVIPVHSVQFFKMKIPQEESNYFFFGFCSYKLACCDLPLELLDH